MVDEHSHRNLLVPVEDSEVRKLVAVMHQGRHSFPRQICRKKSVLGSGEFRIKPVFIESVSCDLAAQ